MHLLSFISLLNLVIFALIFIIFRDGVKEKERAHHHYNHSLFGLAYIVLWNHHRQLRARQDHQEREGRRKYKMWLDADRPFISLLRLKKNCPKTLPKSFQCQKRKWLIFLNYYSSGEKTPKTLLLHNCKFTFTSVKLCLACIFYDIL